MIQSGGPLAAGAAHREGGRNTVKARECVTAQGSEVEDRGGAPAELAARFSAATRTQPREPSRSAEAIRSHSSACWECDEISRDPAPRLTGARRCGGQQAGNQGQRRPFWGLIITEGLDEPCSVIPRWRGEGQVPAPLIW